jgi:hypothetical protein
MFVEGAAVSNDYMGELEFSDNLVSNTLRAQDYVNNNSDKLSGYERANGYLVGNILSGHLVHNGIIYLPSYTRDNSKILNRYRANILPEYMIMSKLLEGMNVGEIDRALPRKHGIYIVTVLKFKEERYIHFNGPKGFYINTKWLKDNHIEIPGSSKDPFIRRFNKDGHSAICEIIRRESCQQQY